MTSKKCAFLTMPDPGDFVTDYDVSYAAMAALGWDVTTVPWRNNGVDWNRFDAVYICTPWDYPQHLAEFIALLETIEESTALLVNPLSLVHWSLQKTYLRDLEQRGVPIVPSLWFEAFDAADVTECFDAFSTTKVVIKPQIGTNATDASLLQSPLSAAQLSRLAETFCDRPFFVQPFVESIRTEGEYSLFYFGGDYSHATVKIPKAGDFRVQEEHGAEVLSIEPEDELLLAGTRVLSAVEPQPVYVRIDLVRGDDAIFRVMELEMIEPSLYLRMDDGAAGRFAAAFDHYYSEKR